VTDPKGENYAVTARARRSLGQVVHALDPFDAVGGTAALNPLDLIDTESPDALDDARLIAAMLVVADSKAGGEHTFWNEEARGLLTGFVLHVAASAPPELRTLAYERELLTLPPLQFEALLDEMLESQAADGLVARAAARVLQKAEKERSGVISTAQNHTHFLDSPRMARVMGASTFALKDLKRDRASVYLVLPPERMDGYHRWLRLMIAAALLAMTRTDGQPPERVLFLLDEFAHLGRMQPVERDIGLAAGYGVTFWLLLQDLAQLRATYPDRWATFLANCEVLQAFGTNDWETAEHLSKLTGETTIQVASENRSRGVSRGQHAQRNEGEATTLAERGRRLLTADEVLRLPADEALLFLRGRPAIRAGRMDYRASAELSRLADANPLHPLHLDGVMTSA
jgi:type IV secretion system protein VirD4